MTSEERQSLHKHREQAQQGISDIDALAKSEPFNRYFVGRLNGLYRKELDFSLSAATVELREKARVRAVLLKELADMPGADRLSFTKTLEQPLPQDRGPIQVG